MIDLFKRYRKLSSSEVEADASIIDFLHLDESVKHLKKTGEISQSLISNASVALGKNDSGMTIGNTPYPEPSERYMFENDYLKGA
jgi:hypothetical protein